MIEITHTQTGEYKNFPGKQEVADFLAGRDDADQWTGHERYGALPDATPQEVSAAVEGNQDQEPGSTFTPVVGDGTAPGTAGGSAKKAKVKK